MTEQDQKQLGNILWGIADQLRGAMNADDFRDYMLSFLFLRYLSDNYEHKHQSLSAHNPERGLLRMTVDICKSLFRTLASEGAVFSPSFFKSLAVTYLRNAEDTMVKYEADATINGLAFDRHEEAKAVEAFARGIAMAASGWSSDKVRMEKFSRFARVLSEMPGSARSAAMTRWISAASSAGRGR